MSTLSEEAQELCQKDGDLKDIGEDLFQRREATSKTTARGEGGQ